MTPATLGLAAVVFLLPFLSVSCDAPGGYGRARGGATSTYSGADLAFGERPAVDARDLRPVGDRRDDTLGAQPLLIAALVGILGALAVALTARRRWRWRLGLGAGSGLALVVGLVVARAALVDKVAAQLAQPLPRGKAAADYVAVGAGFWVALGLVVVAVISTVVEQRTAVGVQDDTVG